MVLSRTVKTLLLVAGLAFVASYTACQEGYAHDQSGFCVIDPFMPPAFLGFEHWSAVGTALTILASGLVIAAVMIVKADSE